MRTSLVGGDLRQGLWRSGTERAARSGEQNAVHPLGPARGIFRQALKNSRMLAVDGQQRPATLGQGGEEERSGDDQRLLVGQQQSLARTGRSQTRRQTGSPDDCGHDGIHIRM